MCPCGTGPGARIFLKMPRANSDFRVSPINFSAASCTAPKRWLRFSTNAVTFGGNNRTHMVRIPEPGRFELRLADGAANPYLLQAGILAAGLDGVAHRRDPGKRLDINMYTEGHKAKDAKRLPLNLLDALRETRKSRALREAFGDAPLDSYLKLKQDEWNSFARSLTAWETKHTLDC
jgi:glutamate---methylamine ligase